MKFLTAIAFVIASAIAFAPGGSQAAGDGELYIDPQSSYVGPGWVFNVNLVAEPPDETLAAWVIRVYYDPTVVEFVSCQETSIPSGSIGVADCGMTMMGPNAAAVSVGATLDIDTELGLDATTVLMTVTFEAIGTVPDSTDLEIEVLDFLTPDGINIDPFLTDGYVEITNDPPPSPTPSPTPSPPPTPTPIPIGGAVELTTARPSAASFPVEVATVIAVVSLGALAAFRLTRWPQP